MILTVTSAGDYAWHSLWPGTTLLTPYGQCTTYISRSISLIACSSYSIRLSVDSEGAFSSFSISLFLRHVLFGREVLPLFTTLQIRRCTAAPPSFCAPPGPDFRQQTELCKFALRRFSVLSVNGFWFYSSKVALMKSWTNNGVYMLGSTVYKCACGDPPPKSRM